MPPLDPKVEDLAPDEPALTPYDEQHAVTYVRLLDAEKDNADWQEVVRIVLHIDPAAEPNSRPPCLRQSFGSRQVGGSPWLSRTPRPRMAEGRMMKPV